jgi:hypothetical protein
MCSLLEDVDKRLKALEQKIGEETAPPDSGGQPEDPQS